MIMNEIGEVNLEANMIGEDGYVNHVFLENLEKKYYLYDLVTMQETAFKKIPVTVLNGYLGAGKTTLLNHVLNNWDGLKVAVIVNDLSEVNIDADLIRDGGGFSKTDEKLIEMLNGCICCTLREDLLREVEQLSKESRFDYILIESSGIGEPIPVNQTFTYIDEEMGIDLSQFCLLDCMVTLVDALWFWHDFSSGESLFDRKQAAGEEDTREVVDLLISQIEYCDLLNINKCNLILPEALQNLSQTGPTNHPFNSGQQAIGLLRCRKRKSNRP